MTLSAPAVVAPTVVFISRGDGQGSAAVVTTCCRGDRGAVRLRSPEATIAFVKKNANYPCTSIYRYLYLYI